MWNGRLFLPATFPVLVLLFLNLHTVSVFNKCSFYGLHLSHDCPYLFRQSPFLLDFKSGETHTGLNLFLYPLPTTAVDRLYESAQPLWPDEWMNERAHEWRNGLSLRKQKRLIITSLCWSARLFSSGLVMLSTCSCAYWPFLYLIFPMRPVWSSPPQVDFELMVGPTVQLLCHGPEWLVTSTCLNCWPVVSQVPGESHLLLIWFSPKHRVVNARVHFIHEAETSQGLFQNSTTNYVTRYYVTMLLVTNYNYLVALGMEHQESLSEQTVFSVFINLTGTDHLEKAKPPNHLHTFSYLDSPKVGGNRQKKCITR